MRSIKFRAWSNDVSDMFFKGDNYGTTHDFDCLNYARSQDIILMQFTGLADDNGVDIYEGDIVSIIYDGEPETIHKVYWGGVEYPAFEFSPNLESECNGFSEISGGGCYELKVIGNIHQNPELLEQV